ncbi:type II toxin-antitoxin system VapC family toxin [Mesorhizobium sp. B3-1-9]|uniref:type II toxin-antitoxin system VapC family toxin n=1 Tax=Mesorhizobium sp. B3-1-9 TaxID=2589892 RepID=UPI00112954AA|nr:type II toxin-antitoxin system VapC family toxin [Mesorhizobium sp. B3-1-9]TPI35412.1 type II toxin-antitoxin system VapC family toxin [Mesorhizobium sp. B3-1-9]
MIIVDASIFIKLFRDEDGSEQARNLFAKNIADGRAMAAPSILLYESLSAALHYEQSFVMVATLIAGLREGGFQLLEPDMGELAKTQEIATQLSPAGGYPTLNDCVYYAMAINRAATLVTADQRHFAKTKHLGSIVLLADWRAP